MSFAGITRIRASGFRGATQPFELVLDPKRPFVLLYGDNGSGKSTLADAIELAVAGTKGSLADVKSALITDLATKGVPAGPLRVELEISGLVFGATMPASKPQLSGPSPRPRVLILRRARLAAMAVATPGDRYEELKRFIDVDAVVACEAQLEKAVKDAKARLDDSAKRYAAAAAELETLWGEAVGVTSSAADTAVAAHAWATDLVASVPDDAAASETGRALGSLAGEVPHAHGAQREASRATAQAGAAVVAQDEARARLDANAAILASVPAEVELLRAAKAVLAGGKPAGEHCPLCTQPIARVELAATVDARLTALSELDAARRQVEAAARQAQVVEGAALLARRQHGEAVDDLRAGFARALPHLPPTLVEAARRMVDALALEEPPPDLDQELARLRVSLEAFASAGAEQGHLRAGVKRALDRLEGTHREAEDDERLSRHLDAMLLVVRDMRKAHVESVLGEVAGEVNRLYAQIHPGEMEVLGSASFHLDPKTRASLLHRVRFGSAEDVAPQACYSESHLLTLALCLWLALAKRERPAETVLVLDDVVSGIDAAHMKRLAALLAHEGREFAQVILTTHSQRLRRYLQSGLGPTKELDCRSLRWGLAQGIACGLDPADVERLQQELAKAVPHRETVAGSAVRVLEALLRQLTLLYRRPVPFGEPPEPTLGELLDAWPKKVAARIRLERDDGEAWRQVGSLGDRLAAVRELEHVRNQVAAHLSAIGDEVPAAEVESYGRAVASLAELLLCDICGQLPCQPKDEAYRCSCKTGGRRMLPVQLT